MYIEKCLLLSLFIFIFYKLLYRFLGRFVWINNWRKKAVFITGCDSGFGQKTAVTFTNLGLTVFAGCLTNEGQESLQKLCKFAPNLHTLSLNVLSEISIQAAYQTINDILGLNLLWAVINNAAVEEINGPDSWLTIDHYKHHMDVNCLGVVRIVHKFNRLLKKSRGRLIIVTSMKGRLVFPECGPYTMSKWALESYSDLMRRELYHFGVTVHIVEPGGFQTALIDKVPKNVEERWNALSDEIRAEYGQEFFEERLNALKAWRNDAAVSDCAPVVNAYLETTLSMFPRCRYVVGWDCWFGYLPVSYMPESLQDWWFLGNSKNAVVPAAVKKNL